MKCVAKWLLNHMAGTYISLAFLTLFGTAAFAVTTYDVQNVPPMVLKSRVDTTTTTGILIYPPERNSVDVTLPTLTGGVLEFTQSNKTEHIYYSIATVDSTSKVITLTGTIIRDLSWQYCDDYITNGSARTFTPGATVKLVNDCRLFNRKADIDRVNVLVDSGAIRSDQTNQPFIFINDATTTQITAFTYTGETGDAPLIKDSTLGVLRWWDGTTWLTLATETGSYVNATESKKGLIEFGTGAELLNRTATGSTGARLAVSTLSLTMTGSSAYANGYIGLLNSSGFHDVRIGGTGSGSNFGSGYLVMTQGTGSFKEFKTVSASNLVQSGANLVANDNVDGDLTITSTSWIWLDPTNLTETRDIATGSLIIVSLGGSVVGSDAAGNSANFDLAIGAGSISGNYNGFTTQTIEGGGLEQSFGYFIQHVTQTGGTITIAPTVKVTGGTATIRDPYFHVSVFE